MSADVHELQPATTLRWLAEYYEDTTEQDSVIAEPVDGQVKRVRSIDLGIRPSEFEG